MCSISSIHRASYPAALAILGLAAHGQLQISEVFADSAGLDQGEQVIELVNVSGDPLDMQFFTLCAGAPVSLADGVFALPPMIVPPEDYVRVHWEAEGISTPTDVYTGLGFDLIQHPIGSLSLCDRATGAVLDYVQWGGDCTDVRAAETDGQWTPGTWVKTALAGHTIAYDGDGTAYDDWFEDLSSTLGFSNTLPGNPETFVYGKACAGKYGEPQIGTAFGPPALGNVSFQLKVTDARPASIAVFAMSPGPASIHLGECLLMIDYKEKGFMILGAKPVSNLKVATLPLPVPHVVDLIGQEIFVQAGIPDFSSPVGFAFTAGLEITL
jgi:hypothetical protein